MKQFYNLTLSNFAAPYGECNYNSSQFDSSGVCGASTGTGGTSGGGLADTGTMVLAFVGIAAAIVLAAMIVRLWRRPAKLSK
ncbi:hypothetical protein IPL68_03065 [Candidatus Saccharibacteria bacterium]|nr:MAG: hypothetical protein IPL68_03065 [Candidatus Saccharibacteria bacterium]